MTSQLHDYMTTQLYDYIKTLLHDYMTTQLHSYMTTQLHNWQLHDYTTPWLHDYTTTWKGNQQTNDLMIPWLILGSFDWFFKICDQLTDWHGSLLEMLSHLKTYRPQEDNYSNCVSQQTCSTDYHHQDRNTFGKLNKSIICRFISFWCHLGGLNLNILGKRNWIKFA